METAKRIKEARQKAGLTQKQLAKIAGVAEITVSQYERGKRTPTIDQLEKIAGALGVPAYRLREGGFGALDPVLPPNWQGVNLDGAKVDWSFIDSLLVRLSWISRESDEYHKALYNITALAESSGLLERLQEHMKRDPSPETEEAMIAMLNRLGWLENGELSRESLEKLKKGIKALEDMLK